MFIPSPIKSSQSFTINLSGTTTATATISAVTTANAYPVFLGSTSAVAGAVNRDIGRMVLTNATTVTATQDAGHNADPTISGMVIEFYGGFIRSIQAGTVSIGADASTTGTATVSAVTVAKCQLNWEGFSGNIGDATTHKAATQYAQVTNATTITFTLGGVSGGGGVTVIGAFTLTEFR